MDTPLPSLVDVEDVRGGVEARLAAHLDALSEELTLLGPDTADLVSATADMLAGGKRLRAAFCYWSWRAHGGDPGDTEVRDAVLGAGAALELFQAAALFHDDVMDDSDTRRGRPAAHRAFAAMHARRAWSGDAGRFGGSAAILLGDLALIASDRELTAAFDGLAPSSVARARAVFDRMRTEVTVGQYLDVLAQVLPWGADPVADEERARQVIRAKSARYSVEHPLSLGATLAGADAVALERCRDRGLPLGEAFQLRDDLLGVFGEPATTGKPAGDDLREGKRTVLVSRALASATADDGALLVASLGRADLSSAEIERLREVLHRSGAVDSVEALISSLAAPALHALETSDLAEPGRSMLVELGRAAVYRTA